MFGLDIKIIMILATIGAAASIGAYWLGRHDGRMLAQLAASEEARRVEQEVNQKISDATWRLHAQSEKLQVLQGQLDQQALEDPDADRPAFSRDSVLRLNANN